MSSSSSTSSLATSSAASLTRTDTSTPSSTFASAMALPNIDANETETIQQRSSSIQAKDLPLAPSDITPSAAASLPSPLPRNASLQQSPASLPPLPTTITTTSEPTTTYHSPRSPKTESSLSPTSPSDPRYARRYSRKPAEDWVEITDPQTGKLFYANILTGYCTWDKPNGPVKPSDPNGDWWEFFDDNYRLPYYYNTLTKETVWERPSTGYIVPLVAIQKSEFGRRVSQQFFEKRTSLTPSGASSPTKISKAIAEATAQKINQMSITEEQNAPGVASSPKVPSKSGSSSPFTSLKRNKDDESSKTSKRQGTTFNPETLSYLNPFRKASSTSTSSLNNNNSNSSSTTPTTPTIKTNTSHLSSPTTPLSPELSAQIRQFSIDGFAKKYFAEHRKGLFRRRVPLEKMLRYSKSTLTAPLMVLNNKNLHKDALKCFKLIQKIMGDRQNVVGGGVVSGGNGNIGGMTADIAALLERGINRGELRDEIYVQLCKQLNSNPSNESIFRGWQLMCVITMAFPPSKNLEVYLKDFILQHFTVTDNRVDLMARHAYKKLVTLCKRGPRGKVPSLKEIERALDAAFNPSVFGETLEDIMKLQKAAASASACCDDDDDDENGEKVVEEGAVKPEDADLKIPKILLFLTESIIQLNGFKTEGIFRVPGDSDEVNDLKVRVEKGIYSLGDIHDPNVPGSLLKFWMRDLAEPLIPADRYEACIDIGRLELQQGAEDAVKLIENLPEINKAVAIFVIQFLKKAAALENQSVTKMTIANIAMVFAPNFLRCPSDNPGEIFENTKYEQSFLRKLIEWSPF